MLRSFASLRDRLRALVTVVLAIVLTAAALTAGAVGGLRDAQALLDLRLNPAAGRAADLAARFVDQETAVRGYLLTGDPTFLDPYRNADVDTQVNRLRELLRGFPTSLAALDDVEAAHDAWLAGSAVPAIADAEARQVRDVGEIARDKALFDALRGETDELDAEVATEVATATSSVSGAARRVTVALAVTAGLVLLLVAVVAVALRRWVLDPVETLASSVRGVNADGTVTAGAVVVPGGSELSRLSRDIEGMRERLVDEIARAERAVQGLRQRGPAVVALRDALAPALESVPGVVAAGRLVPADGVLAGDWYDVLALPERRIAVVVGDVAGHGPAAGVFALRLKQLLAVALTDGRDPASALDWVAGRMGDAGELFATVAVLVLRPDTGELVHANAGHPPVVVVGRSGLQQLTATGPLLSDITSGWRSETVPLSAGDVVVVHTDGIVEARNTGGEEYGEERLHELLAGVAGHEPADVVDTVLEAVQQHAPGRAADDRTAVALRVG